MAPRLIEFSTQVLPNPETLAVWLRTLVCCVAVSCATQAACVGQVQEIRFVEVDNSSGGAELDGFVTNDLLSSWDGQYTGTQMVLELSAGSIYQHPSEASAVPPPGVQNLASAARFDTFVTHGGPGLNWSFSQPGGGAVDLGGEPKAQFDGNRINQSWNPSGIDAGLEDEVDFMFARITLSEDAVGTVDVLVSAAGVPHIERDIPIVGRVIGVPEPGAIGLVGSGLLFAGLRRRSAVSGGR